MTLREKEREALQESFFDKEAAFIEDIFAQVLYYIL